MSGRDRDRDRERGSRSQQQASSRMNEYFVPREGIDREVITADICRYLGNDALVRPGNYENPQTRQLQQGYFITAYRNLTSAMMADLKADSERWEAERRQTASRGLSSNAEYRASEIHHHRQYYGPSTETAPGNAMGYSSQATGATQQGVYDNYQQSYSQSVPGYGAPQGYATQENYYPGSDLQVDRGAVDPRSTGGRGTLQPTGAVPRTAAVSYSSTPTYQQPDARSAYYSSQPSQPVASVQGYATTQQSDPFYGRAAPQAGAYGDPTQQIYDNPYQDTGVYSQATMASTATTPATAGPSRRDRDRDSERDRHGHRRR